MSTWSFFLATFGCKVNQYESQSLREAWSALEGVECDHPENADWIVLNTCAVTSGAVSETRQTARRLHRLAPQARILITGCSATAAGEACADLPGVVGVIPQVEKERLLHGPEGVVPLSASPSDEQLFPAFSIAGFKRARPVIKVQDGCTHRCTYCIVPLMRGPSRSREPEAVIAEARRLLLAGHREIMLSGVNLRQYIVPGEEGKDFWDLLARLDAALADEWAGRARLRLSSLDPAQLNTRALDTLAATRMACPHLHLSLQSGSADVLRRMGRGHYSPESVLDFVRALGDLWPLFGLGADILMGFPTETEAQAAETLNVVDQLPLSYAHVFPFSPRPGTPAANLKDLPGPVKQARAAAVRQRVTDKQAAFLENLLRLPLSHVAPDISPQDDPLAQDTAPTQGFAGIKGVNEFYAACLVEGDIPKDSGHELLPVRPVAISSKRLVTRPSLQA